MKIRVFVIIACFLSLIACSSQASTIEPTATVEVTPSPQPSPTAPLATLGPREPAARFGLVFDQQYALREANDTFRYVQLLSQRATDGEGFTAYHLGVCPQADTGVPLVLSISNYGRLTSIEAALAEGLHARNEACAEQTALPFLGPGNGYPLQVSTGKQYAIVADDGTFEYYRFERRELRSERHFYFSQCPNPISPDRLMISGEDIFIRLMTIQHALDLGYTPTNEPCNSSVLHGS